jgi:translation initiation factor 2B subunit (eIF-2B alpha/beta/delta family)
MNINTAAARPRWQAVNELIHELGEVRHHYRQGAPRGTVTALAAWRLLQARQAVLSVTDDAPEDAVAAARAAIAGARQAMAWARQARRRAAQLGDHAAEPGAEERLVARILGAARRRHP